MRRTSLLIAALLLLAVLVAAVAAQVPEEAGLPTAVRARLDQYIASPFTPDAATLLSVVRARRPWEFRQELSHSVLGDSVYFQIDHPLTWKRGSGPSPLPFPPAELWCALLGGQDIVSGEFRFSIVYVGLHMDIYTGDWMVHLGPSGRTIAALGDGPSIVDCELENRLDD